MSSRTYSGTLIFENVFDAIPSSNQTLVNVANAVFSPFVRVVEYDCGTMLGEVHALNFEIEGSKSVVTGDVINRAFIESQLSQGIYEVQIRSLSSCISKDGVCQECFNASLPNRTYPNIGDYVQIPPQFQMQSEVLSIRAGFSSAQMSFTSDIYDTITVVLDGVVLPASDYSVFGDILTLATPVTLDSNIVVKYNVLSRAPFFYWLAKTYGGSLLGLKPLPIRPLTLKPSLLSAVIPVSEIDVIIDKISGMEMVPEDMKLYFPNTTSILEKALLAIAVDSIFSNAVN